MRRAGRCCASMTDSARHTCLSPHNAVFAIKAWAVCSSAPRSEQNTKHGTRAGRKQPSFAFFGLSASPRWIFSSPLISVLLRKPDKLQHAAGELVGHLIEALWLVIKRGDQRINGCSRIRSKFHVADMHAIERRFAG